MKALLNTLVFLVPFLSLGLWIIAARRLAQRRAVLVVEPRRSVPWGMIDILLLMAMTMFIQRALEHYWDLPARFDPNGPTLDTIYRLVASGAARLLAVSFSMLLILYRPTARLSDLGIQWRALPRDLVLGVAAFVMLAPLVFGIQYMLLEWFKIPYEHFLIESLARNPAPELFWTCAIAAVIVAPLAEEYMYRLLLQGWLEKLATRRASAETLLMGEMGTLDTEDLEPGKAVPPQRPVMPAKPRPSGAQVAAWPVLASASLFALMHVGQGPAPIPLFVLALGLGWLYRCTHRILPCIIVHLLLNGTTMLILLAGRGGP